VRVFECATISYTPTVSRYTGVKTKANVEAYLSVMTINVFGGHKCVYFLVYLFIYIILLNRAVRNDITPSNKKN